MTSILFWKWFSILLNWGVSACRWADDKNCKCLRIGCNSWYPNKC